MSAPYAIFRFILLIKSSILFNVKKQNTWHKKVQLSKARRGATQCNSTQFRKPQRN